PVREPARARADRGARGPAGGDGALRAGEGLRALAGAARRVPPRAHRAGRAAHERAARPALRPRGALSPRAHRPLGPRVADRRAPGHPRGAQVRRPLADRRADGRAPLDDRLRRDGAARTRLRRRTPPPDARRRATEKAQEIRRAMSTYIAEATPVTELPGA